MQTFVKNDIEKQKTLYAKKYATKHPAIFALSQFEGKDAIIDFDIAQHVEQHETANKFEEKCQYCILQVPRTNIDNLFKVLMLGQDPEK